MKTEAGNGGGVIMVSFHQKIVFAISDVGFVTHRPDGEDFKTEAGMKTEKRKIRDRMTGWHHKDNGYR